jgi:DNA-binding GntR family transcriptional regulator
MDVAGLKRTVDSTARSSRSGLLPPVQMRVTTLTEQTYQYLKDAIITLELRPGTPISEQQIAGLLGISKSPVREALQRLAREDLVTLEPNRRCVVTWLDAKSVRDWYELRLMLEPASLRRVVDRIEPSTLEFLRDVTEQSIAALDRQDSRAYIHNSDLFHLTLIDLNPNTSLVAFVHELFDKIRRVRVAMYQEDALHESNGFTLEGLRAHESILAQLFQGDFDRAVSLLEGDIHRFIELLDEGRLTETLARVAFTP